MNFSNTLFFTTTNAERAGMLHATLGCAMANVSHGHFLVAYYGYLEYRVRQALGFMAEATDNKISFVALPSDTSVAHSKRYALQHEWSSFINLDDDLLTHYNVWDAFRTRTKGVTHTVGVVDANNCRGFSDYNRVHYMSLASYAVDFPDDLSKAKAHFFRSFVTIPYKWLSQLYMMPRYVFEDENVWNPILEAFKVRGVRGYDIMLEQKLVEHGHKILYTTGAEAHHIGMEHGFIGGQWNAKNGVVDEVVHLTK